MLKIAGLLDKKTSEVKEKISTTYRGFNSFFRRK
tara:strand:+ start:566 stop:667 length:102 start_codon:yes stop_codon:yes gene_type:complete